MQRNGGPASDLLAVHSGTPNAHMHTCTKQLPVHLLQLGYLRGIVGNLQVVSLQYILMQLFWTCSTPCCRLRQTQGPRGKIYALTFVNGDCDTSTCRRKGM